MQNAIVDRAMFARYRCPRIDRVTKVPLGTTPLIDEPFRRVATDTSSPGWIMQGAILRLFPLRHIDTNTVAEALLSIFSLIIL